MIRVENEIQREVDLYGFASRFMDDIEAEATEDVQDGQPRPLGLIKFFSKPEYLQEFIGGRVYANTPRFFRRLEAKGIGDANESIALGWHDGLGPADWVLEIDGHRLTDVAGFEIRFGDRPDFYIQSWMILEQPMNDEHLAEMKESVNRLRAESGPDFAIIAGKDIPAYMERLSAALGDDLNWGTVEYSDEIMAQSPLCKRTAFRYQKEFRFLLGECGNAELNPLDLVLDGNLKDLVIANSSLKLQHKETKDVIMEISHELGFTSDLV